LKGDSLRLTRSALFSGGRPWNNARLASESLRADSVDLNDPITVTPIAAEAFERAGLPCALYGGLLAAAYGEPRESRDADFAVVEPAVSKDLLDRIQLHFPYGNAIPESHSNRPASALRSDSAWRRACTSSI